MSVIAELHGDEISAVCEEIRDASDEIRDVGKKGHRENLGLCPDSPWSLRQLGLGAQARYAVLEPKPSLEMLELNGSLEIAGPHRE